MRPLPHVSQPTDKSAVKMMSNKNSLYIRQNKINIQNPDQWIAQVHIQFTHTSITGRPGFLRELRQKKVYSYIASFKFIPILLVSQISRSAYSLFRIKKGYKQDSNLKIPT